MMMISQPFACENEQPTPLISDSRPAFDVALYSMRTQNSYAHVTDARYVLREPISRIAFVWEGLDHWESNADVRFLLLHRFTTHHSQKGFYCRVPLDSNLLGGTRSASLGFLHGVPFTTVCVVTVGTRSNVPVRSGRWRRLLYSVWFE